MKYLCPKCNQEMIVYRGYHGQFSPDYICNSCNIIYVTEYFINGELYSGRLTLNNLDPCNVIVTGTFEYCCRIYKLKCFT